MKHKITFVCLLLLAAFLTSFSVHAQSSSPQETLNQYISDLQKNPNDYALREKIIKLVQEMKQKPAISREAERFMNRGAAAVKSAKDANDFKDAVAEFEKATMAAPWLANAYYNLGVAQDKAGLYAAAIRSLKLYVLAEPNAPDIRSVEKLIDEIEYRQEKAAKERTIAEIKAKPEEKKKGLRDLVGNWYWYMKEPYDHAKYPYVNYAHYRGEMRGEELFFIYVIDVPYWDWYKGEERVFFIANRLEGSKLIGRFPGITEPGTYEITISQDFNYWEFYYYKDQYTNDRQTYTRR